MGEAKRKAVLLAEGRKELERWGARPVEFKVDIGMAMQVVEALQLALRHPGFSKRHSATAVRTFVLEFRNSLPPEYKALRELVRLGNDPRMDVLSGEEGK